MKIHKISGLLASIIGLAMLGRAISEIGFVMPQEPQLAELGMPLGRGGFVINHSWLSGYAFLALSGAYILLLGISWFTNMEWAFQPVALLFIPVTALLTRRFMDYFIGLNGNFNFQSFVFSLIIVVMWGVDIFQLFTCRTCRTRSTGTG